MGLHETVTLVGSIVRSDAKAYLVEWNGQTLWVDRNAVQRRSGNEISFKISQERYDDLQERVDQPIGIKERDKCDVTLG